MKKKHNETTDRATDFGIAYQQIITTHRKKPIMYVIVTPGANGKHTRCTGVFDTEKAATAYAARRFYSDPRWSRNFHVVEMELAT